MSLSGDTALFTPMKKKPRVIWTFEIPPVPNKGVKYYWYASGSDRRIDMVCIGRDVEDGKPFAMGLFVQFDEKLEEMVGAWFGPIRPPKATYQNLHVDWLLRKKSEE